VDQLAPVSQRFRVADLQVVRLPPAFRSSTMNRRHALLGLGIALLTSCNRKADESDPDATAALPPISVYKNTGCGCCDLWVDHIRKAGYAVTVQEMDNMTPLKERVGIPAAMGSCHTAMVAGYFVEGHVPLGDVQRLLRERPSAKGLVVPGMPIGSPGMEVAGESEPYEVFLVALDGSTTTYARHGVA
jgi:hypothetical protein